MNLLTCIELKYKRSYCDTLKSSSCHIKIWTCMLVFLRSSVIMKWDTPSRQLVSKFQECTTQTRMTVPVWLKKPWPVKCILFSHTERWNFRWNVKTHLCDVGVVFSKVNKQINTEWSGLNKFNEDFVSISLSLGKKLTNFCMHSANKIGMYRTRRETCSIW